MSEFYDKATDRVIRPFGRTEKYVLALTYRMKNDVPVLHSLRIKRIPIRRIIVLRNSKGDIKEELWRSAEPSLSRGIT